MSAIPEAATGTLVENLSKVKFGEVSITFKIHAGRIVQVTHATTELTRHAPQEGAHDKDRQDA